MTQCEWCKALEKTLEELEKNGANDDVLEEIMKDFECYGNKCENCYNDVKECFVEDTCPICSKKIIFDMKICPTC